MKKTKYFHHPGQGEIKSTQTQNGENVRGVHDERVTGNGQNGGNGINREQNIRGLNRKQNEKQRRSVSPAIPQGKKILALVVGCKAQEPTGQAEYGAALGMN